VRARTGPLSAAVLVALIATLAVVVPVSGTAAGAAGVGQYSPPEWLPLSTALGGGELQVGCTYRSGGGCGGHHSYWALDVGIGAFGAPVFGAGAGKVIGAGFQSGGWGNYVRIDHGPFGQSLYGHLSRIDAALGQWVDQSTQLGVVGQTGSANVAHLHYEYYDTTPDGSDDPGDLKACHGNTVVTYGGWAGVTPYSTYVHSDGTTCGVALADLATRYHPIEPARILDSRPGGTNIGPYSSPWSSGATRDINVAGQGGVPPDAAAVVLNVTVVNATAPSFLQLWPTGSIKPTYGSSLNFAAGQIVANAVTVRIGDWGQVRVLNAGGSVDVVVDVAGYYRVGTDGAGFEPVVPARLMDSRATSNVGTFSTPWSDAGSGARDVQIGGLAGVPDNAVAVVLNVTAVNPTADSFLQIWPSGSQQPLFGSSLNFVPGQVVPNAVTVKLGAGGLVRILNAHGSVDVVIDVTGYYTASGGTAFHPVLPDRVLDSRPGTNVGSYTTPWGSGPTGTRAVQVVGRGGIPAGADAVVLNVTAVAPTAPTFVQLWPTGATQPIFGSSLNATTGQIVPNAVTVGLGFEGDILVFNAQGSVDLVADVAGYFA
jgi:hypothetical protein